MPKTIKQIAEEIGVSKQAVRDEIAKQGLQSSLRKNGNQFAIDEELEKLIKSAFDGRTIAKLNAKTLQSKTQSKTQSEKTVDVLLKQSEMLQNELEIKNKQIEELNAELAKEREYSRKQSEKLALLADQAQKLQLADKMIEDKKMIEDPAAKRKPWQFWKGKN